jgi:hypothetical protein
MRRAFTFAAAGLRIIMRDRSLSATLAFASETAPAGKLTGC